MRTGLRSQRYVTQAFLTAMVILCLPGCSGAPEEDWYAIANGADTEVGNIEVRSLLLVANEKTNPADYWGLCSTPLMNR